MPGANASPNPPRSKATWASGLPRWLIWLVVFFGLLFIPAAILELSISGRYLPSVEWLQASRPAVYALWLFWGLAILLLIGTAEASYAKRVFVVVGAITIFSPSVGNIVRSNIPALIATISGTDVQHSYEVIRSNGPNDKLCRTPVELTDMPFMTKLCDVGNDFRAQLTPGQTVVFGGKGTWMGLYVEYMLPR